MADKNTQQPSSTHFVLAFVATTGPTLPVTKPADCAGYGRELPATWVCPECPISDDCFAQFSYNQTTNQPADKKGIAQ